MAQQTQLTVIATPGKVQSFSPKTAFVPLEVGGDDLVEKPVYAWEKQILDLPIEEKQPSFTYELRQRQQAEMEANRVAAQLRRQKDDEAARRVEAFLAGEQQEAKRAEELRKTRLLNLEKAKMAQEEKARLKKEHDKIRRKNLQKARRKLKRQRAKKK